MSDQEPSPRATMGYGTDEDGILTTALVFQIRFRDVGAWGHKDDHVDLTLEIRDPETGFSLYANNSIGVVESGLNPDEHAVLGKFRSSIPHLTHMHVRDLDRDFRDAMNNSFPPEYRSVAYDSDPELSKMSYIQGIGSVRLDYCVGRQVGTPENLSWVNACLFLDDWEDPSQCFHIHDIAAGKFSSMEAYFRRERPHQGSKKDGKEVTR